MDSSAPPGMLIGDVSQPLVAADGSEYLIFLPPTWTATASHPVLLFLHGFGGINNAEGCRNPGLKTQIPLQSPEYAAKVPHIIIIPVAAQRDWKHHFASSIALVDMAISKLGGDRSRVSVCGQSMGGHGAYLYASMAPDRFCSVVSIMGYADGSIDDVVQPLNAMPIWALCVPPQRTHHIFSHAVHTSALPWYMRARISLTSAPRTVSQPLRGGQRHLAGGLRREFSSTCHGTRGGGQQSN